mmetsp:Transcript_7648/g.16310  ORF Transcript_7648/g.16310 Transcript_7648/m.16310 type:complete len:80 (+) Transcript_7648:1424-1663(+)
MVMPFYAKQNHGQYGRDQILQTIERTVSGDGSRWTREFMRFFNHTLRSDVLKSGGFTWKDVTDPKYGTCSEQLARAQRV